MYDELNLPRDHYRAGAVIGQRSRKIMHEYVPASEAWQSLKPWIGSDRLKNMDAPYGHTNHFIHPRLRNSKQRITPSSAQRRIRIDNLCRKLSDTPGPGDLRLMLGDIENPHLPIYRIDPNDPDQKNTLATAVFRVTSDAVQASVYIAADRKQSLVGGESCL